MGTLGSDQAQSGEGSALSKVRESGRMPEESDPVTRNEAGALGRYSCNGCAGDFQIMAHSTQSDPKQIWLRAISGSFELTGGSVSLASR